jgi:hypothetical protein
MWSLRKFKHLRDFSFDFSCPSPPRPKSQLNKRVQDQPLHVEGLDIEDLTKVVQQPKSQLNERVRDQPLHVESP